MAQQIINVGTTANDGTGDLLRNGFIKVNQNFTELYTNRISGSGTDNYIPRFNGTNALENSIIFDNGTNIGIGTTSPLGILHLYKSAATTRMLLDGDAGQSKIITYRTGGLQRFGMYLNNTAESGSNVGSDFQIRAYNDAGSLLSTPFFIKRSSGNVGIGTTSPNVELALYQATTPRFHLQNSTSGSGSTSGFQIALSSTDSYLWNFQNGANIFGTNNSEKMRITSGGNVGIGTSSPVDYQVFGYGANIENRGGRGGGFISTDSTATNRIVFSVDSSAGIGMIKSVTNTPLSFGVNDSEKMRITSSGNVGIGTTNPTEKLHVAGVAQILDDGTRGRITFQISSAQNDLFSTTTGFGSYRNLRLSSNELILCSNGPTERMRITSAGNVGIGTTSPTASAGYNTLSVNGSSGGQITLQTGNAIKGYIYNTSTSLVVGADLGNALVLDAGNTERMRIDSTGNIGIGTTSITNGTTFGGGSQINKLKIASNDYTCLEINGNNRGGSIQFTYGQNLPNQVSGLIGYNYAGGAANELVIFNALSGPIVIGTNNSERMRITSGGDVFVGRTSNWVAVGTDKGLGLFSSGAVYSVVENDNAALFSRRSSDGDLILFRRDTNTVGSISVTTTLTSYNVTSDYRLKQDFKNFNGLELLSKIKVYDFAWNVDNSRMNGVIAHELQEVVPYAVTGEKDGEQMQQVDYSKLVPILIQSIQELKEEIETLKNK